MDINDWNVIMGKRMMRDQLLKDSDKYLISDYPISSSNLELVKQYRQDLRNYMNLPELINYNSNVILPNMPTFPILE
jgi:hypothetical protein